MFDFYDTLIGVCFLITAICATLLVGGLVAEYLTRRDIRRALQLDQARTRWRELMENDR